MTALSRGIGGVPSASAWLQLRARAGLNAEKDDCLQPELLMDWTFGAGRMTTSAGVALLRDVVLKDVGGDKDKFGTHSAKATILSWMAKSGAGRGTRRLLGGHVDQRDSSMLEYSRDALAGPLLEVETRFAKIRAKKFDPDATRSGRWAPEAEIEEDQTEDPQEEHDEESATEPDDSDDDIILEADRSDNLAEIKDQNEATIPPQGIIGNRSS